MVSACLRHDLKCGSVGPFRSRLLQAGERIILDRLKWVVFVFRHGSLMPSPVVRCPVPEKRSVED